MALFSKVELERRAKSINFSESIFSKSFGFTADSIKQYDIFLSHSYNDKEAVKGLFDTLKSDYGYSVYVDWIEDRQLDRNDVNKETANQLRNIMKNCKCLFYATSQSAVGSKWMPWETGFMDGFNRKVVICPLIGGSSNEYRGQEYLGLYPYISEDPVKNTLKKALWVNDRVDIYVGFDSWLREGKLPRRH